MNRLRTSITSLLILTAMLAVGLAALRVSSRLWANSLFSVALLCLVGSVAGLIYKKGRTRAGFVGFSFFGWTYFLIAFGPTPFSGWKEMLVTTPILAILEDKLLEMPAPNSIKPSSPANSRISPAQPRAGFVELTPWNYWTATDRSNPFASDSFLRIGHSLFCLAIATLGGLFCQILKGPEAGPTPSP